MSVVSRAEAVDGVVRGRGLRVLVLVGFAVWFASLVLHWPGRGLLGYSDIYDGVFVPRFVERRFWLREWGGSGCPLPYRDYFLEYPPLVGLLWLVSTCVGFAVSGGDLLAAGVVHYFVSGLFLLVFLVVLVVYLYRLAGVGGWWRVLLFLLLPSTLFYLVYNWDVVAAALAVAGVYYALRGRLGVSAVLLGLSVEAKLLTFGVGLWVLGSLYWRGRRREALLFASVFLAVSAAGFLALLPTGWPWMFLGYHSGWGCENCIYIPFLRGKFDPLRRVLSIFFTSSVLAYVLLGLRRRPWGGCLLAASAMAPALFSYVFTPQMVLLFSSFLLLVLPGRLLPVLLAADAVDAGIILAVFRDASAGVDPFAWGSLTQALAMLRNLLLLLLLVYCLRGGRVCLSSPAGRLGGGAWALRGGLVG